MGKILITDTLLDNLANSIGEKSGETPPMTLAEMKTAVDNLPDVQPTRSYRVTGSGNQTITPSTNYEAMAQVDLTVPSGTTTAPSTISGTSASISTGTNTLTLSKTVSVTPRVSTAGYISSGTAGNSSVSLTASVPTQSAQTIHPSTSDQTISSGTYLTGAQTIKGVTLTNLSAANIVSGVTVKIGDSTDDDCVASVTGTASSGGYFTVTDTTDTAGGTIRTITPTEGTAVIQTSKAVTINSNTTTTITPDTGNTALGQVVVTTEVSGGGGNILRFYSDFLDSSYLYMDRARTTTVADYYNYDYDEIYNILSAADGIILEYYNAQDKRVVWATGIRYDPTDETFEVFYDPPTYNNVKYHANVM